MNTKQKLYERPYYKWVVMGTCVLMIFVALGFCSSNKGLYLGAITSALHIRDGLFLFSDSCRYIATAVLNLFFGYFVIKIGLKRMIAVGFAALIGFCAIYATANTVGVFYLGGVCLGIGLAWTTTSVVGYAIGKWFPENYGTIMGIVLASNGLGTAISTQIVSPIIHNEAFGGFGYRRAYLLTAVILAVVAAIVLALFRQEPTEASAVAVKKKKRGRAWSGMTFREAAKKPYFYIALVLIFLTGACLQSVSSVATKHLEVVGLDKSFIAVAFSLYALMLAAAKILTGVLFDKCGLRATLTISYVIAVVGVSMLALCTATSYTLATVYELIIAYAMPLETVALPLIAADLFGQKEFSKFMGFFVSVNTAGYAIGAPLTGMAFDAVGSYRPALFTIAGIMLVVTVVMQFVLTKAGKVRTAILEKEAELQ